MLVLSELNPKRVIKYFEEICTIPHGSGNIEKISQYCVSVAKKIGLSAQRDMMNNVVIKKPASAGFESHPAVVLQAHLDMVCEKDANSTFDFEKEGIKILVDGDYISADGTTLGGDDGIGVAMILAILEDNSLSHPSIEALFTVDEEIGLLGAAGLDETLITGRSMINIDSEDEGVLTVSCAGGATAKIDIPLDFSTPKMPCYRVVIEGLKGGHSGVEINCGRINSNIIMGKFLSNLPGEYYIISIFGGSKSNAIPSRTVLDISTDFDLFSSAAEFEKNNRTQTEEGLVLKVINIEKSKNCFTATDSKKITQFLVGIKNGVQKMSEDIENLPQTSLNLGVLKTNEKGISLTVSVRSSVNKEKMDLLTWLKEYSNNFGGGYSDGEHYPAWEYRKNSKLRDTMVSVYQEIYGKKPLVEAIHAGLECGVLSQKFKNLDAVSFGPDIKEAHTPNEKLSISSVERSYKYLLKVLENL